MKSWTIDVTISSNSNANIKGCDALGIYKICIISENGIGCISTFNVTSARYFKEITKLSSVIGKDGEELEIQLSDSFTPFLMFSKEKPVPKNSVTYMINIFKY